MKARAHRKRPADVRSAGGLGSRAEAEGLHSVPIIPHSEAKCKSSGPVTADEFDPTLRTQLDKVRDRFWACSERGDYTGAHRARLEYVRVYRLCVQNALETRKCARHLPPRLPCQQIWQEWTVDHLEALE